MYRPRSPASVRLTPRTVQFESIPDAEARTIRHVLGRRERGHRRRRHEWYDGAAVRTEQGRMADRDV